MLDFSPTFIIKPYHQKGGTEVPPYDIDKLLFSSAPYGAKIAKLPPALKARAVNVAKLCPLVRRSRQT